jgi:hypothetical protein
MEVNLKSAPIIYTYITNYIYVYIIFRNETLVWRWEGVIERSKFTNQVYNIENIRILSPPFSQIIVWLILLDWFLS